MRKRRKAKRNPYPPSLRKLISIPRGVISDTVEDLNEIIDFVEYGPQDKNHAHETLVMASKAAKRINRYIGGI